jgi:serine protease AprX
MGKMMVTPEKADDSAVDPPPPSATPGEGPVPAAETASKADEPIVSPLSIDEPVLNSGGKVIVSLDSAEELKRLGITDKSLPMALIIELNLLHVKGLQGAVDRFNELYQKKLAPEGVAPPDRIANTYFRCDLTREQIRELLKADEAETPLNKRAIYRVWPDFPVKPLIDRSVSTVKADAARRSYDAGGTDVTWAVIDSGIDREHPHFRTYETLGGESAELHKDFTPSGQEPLRDEYGHGTHVAGIIAGGMSQVVRGRGPIVVGQTVASEYDTETVIERKIKDATRLAGVAPHCKLVSLKVLDDAGQSRSSSVISALQYVREEVNGNGKLLRIHGVNLSLGYEFDPKWFACGQSPICVEVDRLVRTGVVVVVAAGNTGYGRLAASVGPTSTGLSLTINDPGNADGAITVGSTHRYSPHTYGVSYFSSKGPTGDGRLKPDLVAPGERITSCASGQYRKRLESLDAYKKNAATYIDYSGTSMAAPHVSGAIAAFLSVRQEFIGRPEDVKRIFLESATSLKRERYFQGHGLVDLMRALQSV